jgi:hypothetical protein
LHVEQGVDEPEHHRVAEHVKRPEARRVVLLQAGGDHHVGPAFQDRLDQVPRPLGRIGLVAVDHDEHIRVDVAEHRPHHLALAARRHRAHRRAGGATL